jgi:hypothetical protein
MVENHIHGPGCGCSEYQNAEYTDDLLGVIDFTGLHTLNEKV